MSIVDFIAIIGLLFSGGAFYYAKKAFLFQKYPDGGLVRFREYLLDTDNWKEIIDSKNNYNIWRYEKNIDYEIIVNRSGDWISRENWIPDFPDYHCSKYEISLNIRSKCITDHPILFIEMDGGRWFIPVPEIGPNGEYFWHRNSTQLLIDKIIGVYYGGEVFPRNIEEFSEKYSISLI